MRLLRSTVKVALADVCSDLEQALYASKIISYAQGFMLMREAAKTYNWTLNNAGIAAMWRGGCIIKVCTQTDTESGPS